MNSLHGHLLIADSTLGDFFTRSVVLVVRHSDEGALGLVLNRPSTTTLKDVWQRVSEQPCPRHETIHVGGPCEGPLMAVHNQALLMEFEVIPGIYFSAGRDALEQLVTQDGSLAKFFAGYAGWSPGQLEDELERGAWLTTPGTAEHIFQGDESLWARLTREIREAALISTLKIKHVPRDPSMN